MIAVQQEFPLNIPKVEIVKVDFRDSEALKKRKNMIILRPNVKPQEIEVFKRPCIDEIEKIVSGICATCSVLWEGKIRTLIYNADGFKMPFVLNPLATHLRSFARIDPRFQVWGTAVLMIGYRYPKM